MKKYLLGLIAAGLLTTSVAQLRAETLAPSFANDYAMVDLHNVPGVPSYYGGMVFEAGNPNHLLIAGHADQSNGTIYEVSVTRDANHHVTGFVGPATVFASAPKIDCGLAYGPGGVLFATGYGTGPGGNTLMEFKPGSTSPDKTVSLPSATNSVGTVAFVPTGYPGAGSIQIGSFNNGGIFTGTLTADGSGTYNLGPLTKESTVTGNPEGLTYVPLGSAGFSGPSMLVSEYKTGSIGAYLLNADGSPNVLSRQDFITGLWGANGGAIDPLTGDFFFATFGDTYGSNRLIEVQGFGAKIGSGASTRVPEPSSLALLSLGGIGIVVSAYRRRRGTSI